MSIVTASRRLVSLVAFAALSFSPAMVFAQPAPPPPDAGDPAPIEAPACVQPIAQAAGAAIDTIRSNTGDTLRRIAFLDRNGAPPQAVVRVAVEGRDRTDRIAALGANAVRTLTARCVRQLVQAGAPQRLVESVADFGRDARRAVLSTAAISKEIIQRAAAQALQNGRPGDDAAPTGDPAGDDSTN